ncbi:Pc21g07310 [Penicillium rubens Wisconsin 54-1255]|uniref:Pc21g07310 protein n=2 Tax=Penicillium chrysogenum species complex TaxID=254878 RepID=B6HKF7_PENRW|nr:Pc21g07310 [Penicillium rubens Wisconsin 54-1255]
MTPFQCHVPGCGLSYRRKEHLTRHANSHFQTKCFECSFCDRVFARNDTLRQHVRTQHKTRELQYSRAIQACTYCRLRRSRCDGQSPCGVCFQRGIECSYTQNSRSQALVQSRSRNPRTSPIPSVEQDYPYSPCRAAPFIQAYFDKFHPKWPFLHPATFDPDNEPPFLVQSVVMMGSWAMMEINTQQTAKDLHKRLTSSIYEQRGKWAVSNHHAKPHSQHHEISSSGPAPWPMATYQGILLHLIFSLLQNHDPSDLQLTQVLPEIPSQLLVSLVHSCLKRRMFFYPSILAQFKQGIDPDVFVWLGIEEVKRFNLSLYRVCRHAQVYDTRLLEAAPSSSPRRGPRSPGGSLLSLTDLQFAVPDSDELWHATSDLAVKIAGSEAAYANDNIEDKWISQTARVLQPHDQQFQWI